MYRRWNGLRVKRSKRKKQGAYRNFIGVMDSIYFRITRKVSSLIPVSVASPSPTKSVTAERGELFAPKIL